MASHEILEDQNQATPTAYGKTDMGGNGNSSYIDNSLKPNVHCYDIDLEAPAISTLPSMSKDCLEAENLMPSLLPSGDLGDFCITLGDEGATHQAEGPPIKIEKSFRISVGIYNQLKNRDDNRYARDQTPCPPTSSELRGESTEKGEAEIIHAQLPTLESSTFNISTDDARVTCPETEEMLFTGLKSRPDSRSMNSDSAFEDLSDSSATSRDGWDFDLGLCVNYSDVHMEPTPIESAESSLKKHTISPLKLQGENQAIGTSSLGKCPEIATAPSLVLKRPKNGFIRFAMRYRKQVAEDHPRLDNREISRILGMRWRKLTPENRADYEDAFYEEMKSRKVEHPHWRYGGSRHQDHIATWEPIPTRLRPRDKIKRRKIPKMTRPYRRRTGIIHTNWVQCDRCNKWRQLPHGVDMETIPKTWFCENNWPPKNHCEAEEDQEDPEEQMLTQQLNEKTEVQEKDEYRYDMSDYVYF